MSKVALSLVILAALVGLNCCSVAYNDILQAEWSLYKTEFQKTYANPDEEYRRFMNYLDAKHTIAKHNERYAKGEVSFNMGLNQFSDMTNEEFNSVMKGKTAQLARATSAAKISGAAWSEMTKNMSVDARFMDAPDWRRYIMVTPVKDQGSCASSWAFSAIGAIEFQYVRHWAPFEMSVQQIVDCAVKFGCDGFNPQEAFKYAMHHKIKKEKDYPYQARNSTCRAPDSGSFIDGFQTLPTGNETILADAVATWGSISVGIDASHDSFKHYAGGIYDEPACSSTEIDHYALIVGYGSDPKHGDYYIVKNSWSTKWGEEGYVRMSRNKNNQCAIATHASYSIVHHVDEPDTTSSV